MEPRASYVMVGAFVLGLIAAAVVFVLWLAGAPPSETRVPYKVHFTGSVTGLQIGALVRYRGIPVGSVNKISFYRPTSDTVDPDIIEVGISVDQSAPIYKTTIAALEVQGLTGSPYIQLSTPATSGSLDKPEPMPSKPGEPVPIIKGEPSGLDKIFQDMPKALAAVTRAANAAAALLESNDKRIAKVLDNANDAVSDVRNVVKSVQPAIKSLESAISGLKPAIAAIETAASDTSKTIKSFGKVATDIQPVVKSAGSAVDRIAKQGEDALKSLDILIKGAQPAIVSIRKGADAFATAAKSLSSILTDNRRPIADFAATGLYELSTFLTDMRRFVRTFTRLLTRMENDPAAFFFGNTQRGYRTRGRR